MRVPQLHSDAATYRFFALAGYIAPLLALLGVSFVRPLRQTWIGVSCLRGAGGLIFFPPAFLRGAGAGTLCEAEAPSELLDCSGLDIL